MVRAVATEDVKGTQWIKVLGKETAVGSLLGITMELGVGFFGLARGHWTVGLAVGLATTAILLVSNLINVLFPVWLNFLRIDPTLASSPMVTSTADVTGLLLYFSFATTIIVGGTVWGLLKRNGLSLHSFPEKNGPLTHMAKYRVEISPLIKSLVCSLPLHFNRQSWSSTNHKVITSSKRHTKQTDYPEMICYRIRYNMCHEVS